MPMRACPPGPGRREASLDALETLRSKNRFDEELPSGLKVTIRLPRIRDCILAGGVPLPVLDHLVKAASNGGAPAAFTTKITFVPGSTDRYSGWAMMSGESTAN